MCRRAGRAPPAAVLVLGTLLALPAASRAGDHHTGYYYPVPQTSETYKARAETLEGSDRTRRVLFVTELTNQMLASAYPPQVAIYAKGTDAQKMIITSLYAGAYDTLYRMRGLLAMLSARARATPLFHELRVEDVFTFFDLLKMLGFTELTVTDGDRWAHRIFIEPGLDHLYGPLAPGNRDGDE